MKNNFLHLNFLFRYPIMLKDNDNVYSYAAGG